MRDGQPQRPADDDPGAWILYWKALGMPWRIEPEIGAERQRLLAERRAVKPDIERGIYPFRDENGGIKLDRADVEWLLATHESGDMRGPVDWSDEGQREREGLDLRGGILTSADLSALPLDGLIGGLTTDVYPDATSEQRRTAGICLEKATCITTRLRYAELCAANLKGANLTAANLQGAYLTAATLDHATLSNADITNSDLGEASLQEAHVEGILGTHAYLAHAHAERADFEGAQLRQANLNEAHLEEAIFNNAHLEGACLESAQLAGASLHETFFDRETRLHLVSLVDKVHGIAMFSDVHWGDANVSVIRWAEVPADTSQRLIRASKRLNPLLRERLLKQERQSLELSVWEATVRSNRQLSDVLRSQGINEDADRFAYRAQVLQREVLRRQHRYGRWLFSWFLDAIAGHGYKPERSLIAYLIAILGFGIAYYLLGQTVGPHLSPLGAFVFSMTSFHGRGFFPGGIALDDPITVLAALEAFVGLVIEVSFIATFTQRFFAR